ncbi:MAG: hypothetical protein ACT4TC_24860, partial [Myxococcaceae bacterium]
VFAPNAALRPLVVLKPPALLATPVLRTSRERVSLLRPPRLDWSSLQRRTFGFDVWTCHCGGNRKVLAVITSGRSAEELLRNLGRLPPRPPPPTAQAPPQLHLAM